MAGDVNQFDDSGVCVMGELEKTNAVPAVVTHMDMLQLAISKGASIEQLQQLMDLKERHEANEAKKAYASAMALFKENPIVVQKDKLNKQYGSMYASLPAFVNAISPGLSKYGLSFNWSINQENGITVSCVITHVLGHSEKVSLSGSPDKSGSKNDLQQIKSTITYLEGATLQAITGIVSSDFCMDDDGNGESKIKYITESQAADLNTLMADAKKDKGSFLEYYEAESIEKFPARLYNDAIAALNARIAKLNQKKAS